MHPTTSELSGQRDGEGSLALRAGLQTLPELQPPPGAWDRILAEHDRRRRVKLARQAAAAAMVLVTSVVLIVISRQPQAPSASRAHTGPSGDIRELVAASRDLENVLRAPALQSPVLRPVEAARIVALEDRIALIDVELGAMGTRPAGDRTLALWSDRVEALDQLVRVRTGIDGAGTMVTVVNRTNGREP